MPRGYAAVDPNEAGSCQTECLLECPDDAEVRVLVRFLHLQRRTVRPRPVIRALTWRWTAPSTRAFDEAAEREQHVVATVAELLAGDKRVDFHITSGETTQDLTDAGGGLAGRLIRQWTALDGADQPAGRAGGRTVPGAPAASASGEHHDAGRPSCAIATTGCGTR